MILRIVTFVNSFLVTGLLLLVLVSTLPQPSLLTSSSIPLFRHYLMFPVYRVVTDIWFHLSEIGLLQRMWEPIPYSSTTKSTSILHWFT